MARRIIITILVCFLGCSSVQYQKSEGLKVKVDTEAGGYFSDSSKLVHRIELQDEDLELFAKGIDSSGLAPELDSRGGVKGLRVLENTGGNVYFPGLLAEDVVTAVDGRHPSSVLDMEKLLGVIRQSGRGSLTYERAGVPHTIYFYFEKSPNPSNS